MKKTFLRIICSLLLLSLLSCAVACTATETDSTPYNDQAVQEDYYVLNVSSKKIHKPSCGTGARISPENRKNTEESIDKLYELGYTKCGNCFK